MTNGFTLSPADNQAVYDTEIEPALFLGTESVDAPVATIIAGQPGAGKSRVLDAAKREFSDDNVVIVNTDDLRVFHPQSKQITKLDDRQSR
jgi:putative protein kinase ArgK-like GTPase of G3E family